MRQKTGKIRILCYGDSNTFGYIAGNGGRYDRHTRWPGLLQEFLGEAFQVFEAGMCGRTTAFEDRTEPGRNGLEKVDGAVKAHKPLDLLIFMLGSNDCQVQYQLSAPEIANGMEQVLQKAQKSNSSEAKVLLIAPAAMTERIARSGFGSNFDAHSVEMSKELAREYEALAKRQECDFLDGTKVTRVSETDGLHLDAQGHKMLAEAVSEWVKRQKWNLPGEQG